MGSPFHPGTTGHRHRSESDDRSSGVFDAGEDEVYAGEKLLARSWCSGSTAATLPHERLLCRVELSPFRSDGLQERFPEGDPIRMAREEAGACSVLAD
jgi:hypothetical protein